MNTYQNVLFIYFLLLSLFILSTSSNLKARIKTPSKQKKVIETLPKQEILYTDVVKISKPHTCNYLNCPMPYGKCSDENTCICNTGYVHVSYMEQIKLEYCTYKQKSQLVSFFIEFIFFFGVGHFYAERVMIGTIKLIFTYICYLIYRYLNEKEDLPQLSFKKGSFKYVVYSVILVFIPLHIYDLVLIFMNKYLDGKGIPLVSIK